MAVQKVERYVVRCDDCGRVGSLGPTAKEVEFWARSRHWVEARPSSFSDARLHLCPDCGARPRPAWWPAAAPPDQPQQPPPPEVS